MINVSLLLFLMTGGVAGLAGPQTEPLWISEPVISVALDKASLYVVIVPDGQAGLRITPVDGRRDGGVVLESDGRTVSVKRQTSYQGRITLELRMTGDQQLQLVGRDLEVEAEGSSEWLAGYFADSRATRSRERREAARARRTQREGASRQLPELMQLELVSSSLRLHHLANFVVVATDSNVHFRSTGPARVTSTAGTLTSLGHRGALELHSSQAEVKLENTVGRVRATVTGGSLDVIGGRGDFVGSLNSATVRLSDRVGRSTLTGKGSYIEVLSASRGQAFGGGEAEVSIAGDRLEIVVGDYRGAFTSDLTGRSSLLARAMTGSIEVRADGESSVQLEQHEGAAQLGLSAGSEGLVVGLVGTLSAQISESTLEVVDVLGLDLVARAAGITVREVKRTFGVDALDSNLELDLRELSGDPRISLSGESHVQVLAALPCQVGSGDPNVPLADWTRSQLEVTGCEVHATGVSSRRRPGLEGRLPILIQAALSERSVLVVSGVPVR